MIRYKQLLFKYLPLLPIIPLLAMAMFYHSCANTTTPPTGGDKDTIPPFIVGISPLPGSVNVPVHNTQIAITFNEYVKVKDPKCIFLSPPLERQPRYKMRGKTLIVYFESDLEKETTYTLDFTGAIVDNNEGNPFPGYTIPFSTGSTIDSMVVTGVVRDCNTLSPIKGATVLLYTDLADSAVFKHRPSAAVKTDDWGFFSLRNVSDSAFRLYALVDEGANNIYDPENDKIAFVDSILKPVMVVSDTLKEILKYDMKDTLRCMARKEEHELLIFRERPTKQIIVNKERVSDRSAYVTFMAPDVKIDSIWVRGYAPDRLITQFNIRRDSLELWINDRRKAPDTLYIFVDYLKTDSTGTLTPFLEHLRLPRNLEKSTSKSSRRNLKHEDTTCVFKLTAEAERVEQYGFQIEFEYPIINQQFDSLKLKSVNPKQQESLVPFTVTRDSLNLRRYTIFPSEKLLKGYEYKLKVPWRIFRNINGHYNDSTEVKVSLPNKDDLSSLKLNLTGVNSTYIVDLLNEKRDRTLRSYVIREDSVLDFPYLREGKYSIRITEDLNSNGIVDTGSLLDHRQPEKVKFFRLKNGTYVLNIPAGAEMEQNIDIAKLFE